MRIEILKAGTGDCIWISHNNKNIVIDGGKSTSAIKKRYAQMPKEENIDLLIVTHIDSDHIAGVIALVGFMQKQEEIDRLKQIWFNFPKREETCEFSVDEANELSSVLCKIEGLCWNNNTSEFIGCPQYIGNIKLHVLAPDYDVTNDYKPKPTEEFGAEDADWDTGLSTLIEYIDDDDLEEGGPNSQSIVILAECEGKMVLLTGDCTPNELYEALHTYNSINGTQLKLDLMKLPHHGSTRNITKAICSELECSNFVISSNVNRNYCFPNKETIAILISYRRNSEEAINIYFNYQESLDILGITEEELTDFNIKLSVCREHYI